MIERVKVEGLKEVRAALMELPKATAKNVMRRVLKKRAAPIVEAARRRVPVDQGDLRESIVASTRLTRRQRGKHKKDGPNDVEIFIGPDSRPQAHWVEFGTEGRKQRKTGKDVGRVIMEPYMRPAWDAERMGVLDGIREDMWEEIEKAVSRRARKAAKEAGG